MGERVAFTLAQRIDPDGAMLRHRARNILTVANLFEERGGTHEELIRLANEATALNDAALEYCAAQGLRYGVSGTPMPSALVAMHEAVLGPPSAETLVECPACAGCTLCHGAHLVSTWVDSEWRRRNSP